MDRDNPLQLNIGRFGVRPAESTFIRAIQFQPEHASGMHNPLMNGAAISLWCGGRHRSYHPCASEKLEVPTLDGVKVASPWDWVVLYEATNRFDVVRNGAFGGHWVEVSEVSG